MKCYILLSCLLINSSISKPIIQTTDIESFHGRAGGVLDNLEDGTPQSSAHSSSISSETTLSKGHDFNIAQLQFSPVDPPQRGLDVKQLRNLMLEIQRNQTEFPLTQSPFRGFQYRLSNLQKGYDAVFSFTVRRGLPVSKYFTNLEAALLWAKTSEELSKMIVPWTTTVNQVSWVVQYTQKKQGVTRHIVVAIGDFTFNRNAESIENPTGGADDTTNMA